jgi:two-component system, chemotaxis family, chemotaxis protein CheY
VSKRILVIDDSPSIRLAVTKALTGYDIVQAVDGQEGAELIESLDDLSLAICDVNMPRMTGIEMLERVHETLKKKGLKIIMLTTEGQPGVIKRARELGASGWVVKPFKPEHLLATAKKLTG